MQLSEFSLTTVEMEAGEVLKALSTVIPEARIQQAIEATHASGRTAAPLTNGFGGGTGDWHEFVVTRINC